MTTKVPNEWRKWTGGPCPVLNADTTLVDVLTEDGREFEGIYASEFRWSHVYRDDKSSPYRHRGNIVKWRVSVAEPAAAR